MRCNSNYGWIPKMGHFRGKIFVLKKEKSHIKTNFRKELSRILKLLTLTLAELLESSTLSLPLSPPYLTHNFSISRAFDIWASMKNHSRILKFSFGHCLAFLLIVNYLSKEQFSIKIPLCLVRKNILGFSLMNRPLNR